MRVALALVALLAAGCNSPTAPDRVVPGRPFTLKVGESATLPGNDGRMGFVRLVSDSRCPLDALCITAGDAVIQVSFTVGHLITEVHTDPRLSQIPFANYVIRLTELQPYPQASAPKPPEDYVATFVLQPL
jgi:hypothetical protein